MNEYITVSVEAGLVDEKKVGVESLPAKENKLNWQAAGSESSKGESRVGDFTLK